MSGRLWLSCPVAITSVFLFAARAGTEAETPVSPALSLKEKTYFEVRGGLDNCRAVFLNTKKGRVAYLGGSITTMGGWRDLTYDILRKQFPQTEFDFINAGIGGTNSTLGAIRFEEDVFARGPVDLLFLEFAVNDEGQPGPDNRRARAMEGIIRRARSLNPHIDIIVQYFADTGKVEAIRKGEIPQVISDHDRIAAHYGVPVLNLAKEMTRRLDAKEFAWEQFSRDTCHPNPFGHERYAECITEFLKTAWKNPPATTDAEPMARMLPAALDEMNYERAGFIALDKARVINGWKRIPKWDTEKKCNYGGAVDVLAAEAPGDALELEFEGSFVAMYGIAGMDAGILECSIDGGEAREIDLYDHYCQFFHRPVCRMLAEGLKPGRHTLRAKMSEKKNERSSGHAARALRFAGG
ncbi:MAG TPA: SGNH/GDSL hydrolase family protein [Candidatus Brocadiia bacterium]|nr:SGNH/GDSL hydrolase family protein [Candidatus Brocadiia bacterium]